MQHQACTTDHLGHHHHWGKGSSWFPVIMGGLVGLGLGFLLNLFSMAIGLSLFTTSTEGAKMLAAGGIIGMLIGVIASMYTTGLIAGYLSGYSCCTKNLGALYGFAAWCFSLILMALLASSISNYVAAYTAFADNPNVGYQVAATTQETAKATSNKVNPTVSSSTNEQEREVRAVGLQSFIIFVLFFVGAFSAALGGYMGFECWRRCKEHNV